MLDQSYSVQNLRAILELENRKGNYLEPALFPRIARIDKICSRKRVVLRRQLKMLAAKKATYRRLPSAPLINDINSLAKKNVLLRRHIARCCELRRNLLDAELYSYSKLLSKSPASIKIRQLNTILGKDVYAAEKGVASLFQLKQAQYNLRKVFGLRPVSRDLIVSQLSCVLEGKYPKLLVRTDIKSFYESIDQNRLLKILGKSTLLDSATKKIVTQILDSYNSISGGSDGLPRGVGLSAYLAEIYMKDFDSEMRSKDNVIYYARYVDDIVLVFDSGFNNGLLEADYLKLISEKCSKYNLDLNDKKTESLPLPGNGGIDYLGYKIKLQGAKVLIDLSAKRTGRYKKRIDLAFSDYMYGSCFDEKKAGKLLYRRIRFLTGNARLHNNKRNAMVGIYFTNSLLNTYESINSIDKYLTFKISKLNNRDLLTRLKKHTFKNGFEGKVFHKFSSKRVGEIVKVWKNVS